MNCPVLFVGSKVAKKPKRQNAATASKKSEPMMATVVFMGSLSFQSYFRLGSLHTPRINSPQLDVILELVDYAVFDLHSNRTPVARLEVTTRIHSLRLPIGIRELDF